MRSPAASRPSAAPRRALGAEPVGQPSSEDPDRDDDRRVDEEHPPGSAQPELPCVQRDEGVEACEPERRRDEDEPRGKRGRMDQAALRCLRRRRLRLAQRDPRECRAECAAGSSEPHGVVAPVAEDRLADDGADGEPAPDSERVETDGLAASLLRRDVGDHRRRSDEDHAFADSGHEAQEHQHGERVDERVRRHRCSHDQRADDDEDSSPAAIGQAVPRAAARGEPSGSRRRSRCRRRRSRFRVDPWRRAAGPEAASRSGTRRRESRAPRGRTASSGHGRAASARSKQIASACLSRGTARVEPNHAR